MPTKPTPTPSDVPAEPTPEERRAAKLARLAAHRARRPRHSASNPLRYNVDSHPPCGPSGGYVITNVPSPTQEIEVTYVEQ